MKFTRASDDVLQENGWDPSDIQIDPEEEGPYAVAREKDAVCGQCGGTTTAWTVVNLMTASGIGQSWTHDGGDVLAEETAGALNAAWLQGYANNY